MSDKARAGARHVAGFIDAEGCFSDRPRLRPRMRAARCTADVSLRAWSLVVWAGPLSHMRGKTL